MPRVEGEITIPPEQRYAAIVSEFEKRRQKILNPPVSVSLSPWRRLFGAKTKQKTAPSPEEQVAQLEAEFKSQIFSDRSLVVCHLRANPDKQEAIIADYLQSSELLSQDANTLGQFFAFWLLEFCQKADTGPIENLFNFIQTSASRLLPPELHQARREIFEPLFGILGGNEKEILQNIKEDGIFGVSQKLAEALIETSQPLPNGLKKAYQKYVEQLIRIEAGIISVGPSEPEIKEPKNRAERNKKSSPAKPKINNKKVCPQPETRSSVEIPVYSFWIVLGPNKDPIQIKNPEELKEIMGKIKNLGPVTAEDVWKSLQEITSTPPPQIPSRYRERVAGGPFKGWWKENLGGKYRLIFFIKDGELHFRVGPDETVYATRRRKPRDRARSL